MSVSTQEAAPVSDALAAAAAHDAAGRHDDAIDVLARATQAGDTAATVALGKRLLVGDRAPWLPRDGARFLCDALRAGSVEAALRVATLTACGAYLKQSWGEALALLAFAAERGAPSAQAQLELLAGPEQASAGAAPDRWRRLAASVDVRGWLTPASGTNLHGDPLIRLYRDFLPDAVCSWLIEHARDKLKRALVARASEHGDAATDIRTNRIAVYDLARLEVVHILVQHRMAVACGVPPLHTEAPTVLNYAVGEEIKNHYDFTNPRTPNYEKELAERGERLITFLAYLNDDYTGGETDFPLAQVRHKGRRRDGLLFMNALPNGKADPRSVHAGLPPTSGEKWLLSQFFRTRPALNTPAEVVY